MQTFLPYPDLTLSVKLMDAKRLGKQRLEVKQLLTAIDGGSKGWRNHPAAKMWSNNTDALKAYGNECIKEWIARRYNNTMPLWDVPESYEMPWWMGFELFHKSHRDNLFRKDPVKYEVFADADPNGPYIWPHANKGYYHIGNESYVHVVG